MTQEKSIRRMAASRCSSLLVSLQPQTPPRKQRKGKAREFLVDVRGTDYGLSANLRWVVLVANLVNGLKALDGELVEVHPHVTFLHVAPFFLFSGAHFGPVSLASFFISFSQPYLQHRLLGLEQVAQSTGWHRSTGRRPVEVVGAAQRCLCWICRASTGSRGTGRTITKWDEPWPLGGREHGATKERRW